ncbi:MAG: hypothetical protein Q7U04_08950 [Bacteriovorax sp.]|nr:hypothetical protein [Bacteriovorax sp.]
MKLKTISLAVLSLGVCSWALAAEYNSPNIGFKETPPANMVAKSAEFNDEYKVEGAIKTDRQIASEKEASDREPSSVMAAEKKHVMDEDKKSEDKFEPKPWLYRNKLDSAN